MIELALAGIDKIIELIDRRQNDASEKDEYFLEEVLKPLFSDLEAIHEDYLCSCNELAELAKVSVTVGEYQNHILRLRESLLPTREKIRELARGYTVELWGRDITPEVSFLKSVLCYFLGRLPDLSQSELISISTNSKAVRKAKSERHINELLRLAIKRDFYQDSDDKTNEEIIDQITKDVLLTRNSTLYLKESSSLARLKAESLERWKRSDSESSQYPTSFYHQILVRFATLENINEDASLFSEKVLSESDRNFIIEFLQDEHREYRTRFSIVVSAYSKVVAKGL